MIGEDISTLWGLIRQCTNFGLPKTLFPYKDALGRRGETRKSFSLSLEMRVWITVNLKKQWRARKYWHLFFLLPWILIFFFWMVHCHMTVQVTTQKRIINYPIRQSGSILSYLSRNSLKMRRRWETNAGVFYCLPVDSHLGQIIPLHLRIEWEATTFQTAGYINNTALSVTFVGGLKVLNPSGFTTNHKYLAADVHKFP